MRTRLLVAALLVAAGADACAKKDDHVGVDLHPLGVVVSPTHPDTDSTITVDFGIANDGPNLAAASAWAVRLDDQLIGTGTVGAIDGHSGAAASLGFPAFESGSHMLLIVADSGSAVREDNEGNNALSVPITIDDAPAVFDLRSGGTFEFSPSPPTTANALLLWTIRNADTTGSGRAMQSVHWHLLCDGAYVGSGTFPSLAPNETRQQTYQLAGTFAGAAGAHHYAILLDPHHTIHETDETNNTLELDAVVATAAAGG
jgi:hypothetical protein